jgi:tetratricopeptide (TPR) repeat protein
MRTRLSLSTVLWLCALTTATATANSEYVYLHKIGERVEVFENIEQNYRLDLSDEAYLYVNLSEQIPRASFAAVHSDPNAFSLVISEVIGVGTTPQEFAGLVQIAMIEQLENRENSQYKGHKDLGIVEDQDLLFFQKALYAQVDATPVTYVVSATVDGARAYQLLTFSTDGPESIVRDVADKLLSKFSIIDKNANRSIAGSSRPIRDFRSATFGYRFRAREKAWFEWADLKETNEGADIGALSTKGYGTVVMPMCWKGAPPTHNAIYRIMMQQFGEDYPSDFISSEQDIRKGNATGKLLIGSEERDGEDYLYQQWIVANEHCAYTLAAWGPSDRDGIERDLNKLWSDFEVMDDATAVAGVYTDRHERVVNAYLLNGIGLHYYEARSFRQAFRFFSDASDLEPSDEDYIGNAVRSLVEIDAYHEAKAWLQPRMSPFLKNQDIQSWQAWIAYQTNDPERATTIYRALFATDYRDDDDFSAFLSMLADAQLWEELDEAYSNYVVGGVSDKTKLLQVKLLSRRGKQDEALQLLEKMVQGRPFNADLIYQRISILDDLGRSQETLELAQELIDKGYRSLQSYFYKGSAEYRLRSFQQARESFEAALTFAPGNKNIREHLDAIDLMTGQGNISSISTPIAAVPLPVAMRSIFSANDLKTGTSGYGAELLTHITGYEFGGGDTITETIYRKIRIIDDNGISQFSTLEFDFDASYEQLFVNSLVVRDASGEVLAESDQNAFYVTSDEDGYEASTERTVHLPVPGLKPGVIVEAVVSKLTAVIAGTFPLETIYMANERPIGYSALFVTGDTREIRHQAYGVGKPERRGKSLVWELQHPVTYRWEPMQPYFDQIVPWVQLGTVGSTWQSVGEEYLLKIADKLDVSKVSERATRLIDGVEGLTRQIEILSAYVQDEIHYEAIEFGRRAFIPKTARETMRDRYGDCKDHAVLLYSLLRSVDINASLALVNLHQQVLPELPNTDQFNHMIVAVKTEQGPVFIDATDKDLRLGKLAPRSMAGNHALVLDVAPALQKIREYASELTGLVIERTVEPGADGYLRVTENARFTGYQAAEMRGQLRSIEKSEMQASLQRWITTRYTDAELTDYLVDNVFDAGYDLMLEIEYVLPLETDGAFEVPSFLEANYLEYDRVADRRFPFEFSYPLRVSARTSVKIPAGRRLEITTKKPASGESRFGNWQRNVHRTAESWEIQFDYTGSESRFEPNEYRNFTEFQRTAVDAIEQSLQLH